MNILSDLLITIFESFGLYSSENGLGEHLRGLDIECNEYSRQSTYNLIFIYLFAINSLIIINYYYGLFNKTGWNTWFKWLLNVLAGALLLFIIAFTYPFNDISTNSYCRDLQISSSDCVGFGITAFIFSILWSAIFSFIIKWKSNVNRKVPF